MCHRRHFPTAYCATFGRPRRGTCTRDQSSPSNSAASCAADNRITPSLIGGHLNAEASSRFQTRTSPLPSQTRSFTLSARSLKYEEVRLKAYADGREARAGIGAWIAFYNDLRPHQALGYRTPMEIWRGDRDSAVDMPPRLDNADALPTCPQPQQQQQPILMLSKEETVPAST